MKYDKARRINTEARLNWLLGYRVPYLITLAKRSGDWKMVAKTVNTYQNLQETWNNLRDGKIDVAQANAECNIASQMDKCIRTHLQVAKYLNDAGQRALPAMDSLLSIEHKKNGDATTQ